MEAANQLNVQVNILDSENAPAKQISAHARHVTGSFRDRESVRKLAETCDVLTTEIEHVDTYALEEVSSQTKIEPDWKSIRIIQDKFRQKEHLSEFQIPMAEHRELQAHDRKELEAIGAELGYPFMLKSKTQAYDGRGNYRVPTQADIPSALEALKGRPLYAEKWAKFKMELAVIVVKTKSSVLSYPTVETVQENSICKLVYAPARNISAAINRNAQELAKKAVAAFEGKGVFGVEMFLLEDNTLLLCELASRVHNSGHHSLDSCSLNQFQAHLRAILDLPIPPDSLELRQPAIMLNILGGASPDFHLELATRALSVTNANIHLYGKGTARPGRKMGHITVTASTMGQAEAIIQPLVDFADKKPQNSTLFKPTATIGVVMGSDSDLKVLVPGLRLLKTYFEIEIQVDITSAHRTPEWMAEYASTAAYRGIKVIIAGAGGAAHLPGMVAAYTSLPVIGVPVKGSTMDGMDSLLSIVQMPRGVPVLTVGINNSVNAALAAARILGLSDARIRSKVEEYAESAEEESLGKDDKIQHLGWEKYHEQMVER
ncbi:MAG: hypothetical protein LQ351_001630 [Letrouitia transgressa]|nr:MAG: hypothetical protein LQ351_001630 [Letrouitia transgressa]